MQRTWNIAVSTSGANSFSPWMFRASLDERREYPTQKADNAQDTDIHVYILLC